MKEAANREDDIPLFKWDDTNQGEQLISLPRGLAELHNPFQLGSVMSSTFPMRYSTSKTKGAIPMVHY